MSDLGSIVAGDFIECEAAMFNDFRVGHKYEVHGGEHGLYMLGGHSGEDRIRLTECFGFTKELTGDVYAMCMGFGFIKRASN